MTPEEQVNHLVQYFDDESQKAPIFTYSSDILLDPKVVLMPGIVWVLTNSDVRKVWTGQLNYDDSTQLDEDDKLNEFSKGMLWPNQRTFNAQFSDRLPLCEADNLNPCKKDACPLYKSDLPTPICREFKIAFARD